MQQNNPNPFAQSAGGFANGAANGANKGVTEGIFTFERSYEEIDEQGEGAGGPDVQPGVFLMPFHSAERATSKQGNAGIQLNFDSGIAGRSGKNFLFDERFWLMDKNRKNPYGQVYHYFDSRQVEMMRDKMHRVFKLSMPQYFNPTALDDSEAIDRTIAQLNQLLPGRMACVTVDWPERVQPGKKAYLELRFLNHVDEYNKWAPKFEPRPKPQEVSAGARPIGGGMPVNGASSLPGPAAQGFAPPTQGFAPPAQPAQGFAQAPAQAQVQQPAPQPLMAYNPNVTYAPAPANVAITAGQVFPGHPFPHKFPDPQTNPAAPGAHKFWNAYAGQFMYLMSENPDVWEDLPF